MEATQFIDSRSRAAPSPEESGDGLRGRPTGAGGLVEKQHNSCEHQLPETRRQSGERSVIGGLAVARYQHVAASAAPRRSYANIDTVIGRKDGRAETSRT